MNSSVDFYFKRAGQIVLCLAAFLIPLLFCRETNYVFQLKTAYLQFSGYALVLIICAHALTAKENIDALQSWIMRLIFLFLVWQVFKSFNSISSLISFRQLERIYWLPVIAFSVLYFFRSLKSLELLISVIVVSAVIANFYMWAIYIDFTRSELFGFDQRSESYFFRAENIPIFGGIIESIFYPEYFRDVLETVKNNSERGVYPISMSSLYAGKADAGSFGSKNFVTAYINLTAVLMIYRAITLLLKFKDVGSNIRRAVIILASSLLIILAIAGFAHIAQLGNRGSQIGLVIAFVVTAPYIVIRLIPKRYLTLSILGMVLGCFLLVFSIYLSDTKRFESIFTVTADSNELRRHTWTSYLEAWLDDEEWEVSQNKIWRLATGFGTYTFRVIYPKYRADRVYKIEFDQHNTETSHPHNEYLGYLGELGILGLSLYVIMILFLFYRLVYSEKESLAIEILKGALFFALFTQLVHQLVGVGIRYTGVAFQFWLTLGLLITLLSINRKRLVSRSYKNYIAPGLLLLGLIVIMPNPLKPIDYIRSQNFYAMGRNYNNYVAHFNSQFDKIKNEQKKITAVIKENPGESGKHHQALQRANQMLVRVENEKKRYYQYASRYFRMAQEVDPANFEAVYIGANMSIMQGRKAVYLNQSKEAEKFYLSAIKEYEKILPHMPYFVQVNYMMGSAYRGLGLVKFSEFRKGDKSVEPKMKAYFNKAISYYEKYEIQDDIYTETFIDKIFVYSALNKNQEAEKELIRFMKNFEKGGVALFKNSHLDPIKRIELLMRGTQEEERSEIIFQLCAFLREYKATMDLVPFVPKTERHIKNAFRYL